MKTAFQDSVSSLPAPGLALALLGMLLAPGQAGSQNKSGAAAADAGKVAKVALANNSGPPGSAVVIPIYFTPAASTEMGRLKVEISFVSVNLKFDQLERGVAAKIPNLNFTSEVKVGKNDKGVETSTVSLLVSFASGTTRTKGIPGGLLGYLNLRIGAKANAALITLHVTAEGAPLGSNSALTRLQTSDGQVEISWVDAPPSMTCFFFTH